MSGNLTIFVVANEIERAAAKTLAKNVKTKLADIADVEIRATFNEDLKKEVA